MTSKPHPSVLYARENTISVDEFRRVLIESTLDEVRPIEDAARLAAMLAGANLIVTARLNDKDRTLVGVARCVTDFSWCCYLSELAVSSSVQGVGVGKCLIDEVRKQLGPAVSLVLASVPGAVGFYERIGMPRMRDTFCFRRKR